MNALLLIYPVLLLIFTFYGAVLTRDGRIAPDFLAPEQTKMIQACACIGIILHHITQQITAYGVYDKGPVTLLSGIGFLFTALFFFFSGYGLLTSLLTKPDYLHTFLYRRLPTVLIPFWAINALGTALLTFGYGVHTTLSDALSDIFGLTLINSNGWFIVEITIFYLLFYVFFRLIRNRDAALVCLCLAVFAVMVYSFHQGHDPQGNQAHWFRGEWWYNSTITFVFGLVFARFRERLTALFRKHYALWLTGFCILGAWTLYLSITLVRRGGYYEAEMSLYPAELAGAPVSAGWIAGALSGLRRTFSSFPPALSLSARTLLAQSAACIAFAAVVLLMQMRITLRSRPMRYIGTISLELFLIHGYFVTRIFGSVKMNDFLRYALILTVSIASAALLSPLIRLLTRSVIRLLAGADTRLQAAARMRAEEKGQADRRKRAKRRRVIAVICLAAVPAVLILVPAYRNLSARKDFEEERAAFLNADVGDEVLFGRYETDPSKPGRERLEWIVIGRDSDTLRLLSKYGIAGGAWHPKHEAVTWEDCALRERLNSDAFTGMFSSYEKDLLVPQGRDLITLLTTDQLQDIFPEKADRVCAVTGSAVAKGVNADRLSHYDVWFDRQYCYSWWWLRDDTPQASVTAPIVEMDGTLRSEEKAVNKPGGAIRPVILVRSDIS